MYLGVAHSLSHERKSHYWLEKYLLWRSVVLLPLVGWCKLKSKRERETKQTVCDWGMRREGENKQTTRMSIYLTVPFNPNAHIFLFVVPVASFTDRFIFIFILLEIGSIHPTSRNMDLVFCIDYTSSIAADFHKIHQVILGIIVIAMASRGADVRLALVKFRSVVDVWTTQVDGFTRDSNEFRQWLNNEDRDGGSPDTWEAVGKEIDFLHLLNAFHHLLVTSSL